VRASKPYPIYPHYSVATAAYKANGNDEESIDQGAEVEILGTGVDISSRHLLKENSGIAKECMIRFPHDIPSVLGTICVAKLGSKKD
jgi:hypothetical protein